MERTRGDEDDSAKGHYPNWALKRLIQIEHYKEKNLSNEEITKRLSTSDKLQNIQNMLASPDIRLKIVSYASFLILLIIVANETEVIHLSKPKSSLQLTTTIANQLQIVDSGTVFMTANTKKIMVLSKYVEPNSKIFVTFSNDYSPATRYWVAEKQTYEGFYVELDAPINSNVEFNWWITK